MGFRASKRFIAPVLLAVSVFWYWVALRVENGEGDVNPNPAIDPDISDEILLQTSSIETTIPGSAHTHGYTVFDRLYLRNGTFYVVTSDLGKFPPRDAILRKPLPLNAENMPLMAPTDEELRFVTLGEARSILGLEVRPIVIGGLSVIVYDPDQFLRHYYHWWGEVILGFWRVYSSLSLHRRTVEKPRRFLLPFTSSEGFRDRAGLDAPLMRATFPDSSIEGWDMWEDLIALERTFVFEQAAIISRAATGGNAMTGRTNKMAAGTVGVNVQDGFWESIRETTVRNLLGYLPKPREQGKGVDGTERSLPHVVYIIRTTSRRLSPESHQSLVGALKGLEEEGVCKVTLVDMGKGLTVGQQIGIVANATVLVGVHGNGLTHQLWMPPTRKSAVIEIFFPRGYAFDYELVARNIGHKHYAVWNDTWITYPPGQQHEKINTPEGFHGFQIPVHGPTVAKLIREHLSE